MNLEGKKNNILITGVPRSGTTLTCFLLNKVKNTVALHEPLGYRRIMEQPGSGDISSKINIFLDASRHSLLSTGTAWSKQINGKVPDNPFGGFTKSINFLPSKMFNRFNLVSILKRIPSPILQKTIKKKTNLYHDLSLRRKYHSLDQIVFTQSLSNDFLLCVKQNEPFLFLLDELKNKFSCFAIIRNPLAVLASWNCVDFSLQTGYSKIFKKLNHPLHQQLYKIKNKHERQILILHAMYQQIALLPSDRVIRYEEIIASHGSVLQKITPQAAYLNEPLVNKNTNVLYDKKIIQTLSEKLLDFQGAYLQFYSPSNILQLAQEFTTP